MSQAAARGAGLVDFNRQRKAGSREKLLAAALAAFVADGYAAVSVEDIAGGAGVSRMTFYRHFTGKADIATVLFVESSSAALPLLLSIGEQDFRNPDVLRGWIGTLFAEDRAHGRMLRVFSQASVEEPSFTETGHRFIDGIILGLGRTIPAFALSPDASGDRRRWIEAWLLIYEILDQSNHAARGSGLATDPLMIDILAEKFLLFCRSE